MGENNGVIWIIIAALVLGIAIFLMGKLFSDQADKNGDDIAWIQQTKIDESACEANGGAFTIDDSKHVAGWEDAATTATDYLTGTCN